MFSAPGISQPDRLLAHEHDRTVNRRKNTATIKALANGSPEPRKRAARNTSSVLSARGMCLKTAGFIKCETGQTAAQSARISTE